MYISVRRYLSQGILQYKWAPKKKKKLVKNPLDNIEKTKKVLTPNFFCLVNILGSKILSLIYNLKKKNQNFVFENDLRIWIITHK